MVFSDSEAGVIGLCGVFQQTGVPDVGNAQRLDFLQSRRGDVHKASATVLLFRATPQKGFRGISEQSGQKLIKDNFHKNHLAPVQAVDAGTSAKLF